MKKFLFACTAAAILVAGCKKEDEPTVETPSYAFKDQILQGQIEGESWTFVEGEVKADAFNEGTFRLSFRNQVDSTACERSDFPEGDRVLYSTTSLQTGLIEMSLTNNATLFDEEQFLSVVATEGAIEILTIDTVAKIITGRMDISGDEINSVNGNFTINICD